MKGRLAVRIASVSTVLAILVFLYSNYIIAGSVRQAFTRWGSVLYILAAVHIAALVVFALSSNLKGDLRSGSFLRRGFLFRTGICILVFPLITAAFILLYKIIFFAGLEWALILDTWPDLIPRIIIISLLSAVIYSVTDQSLHAYSGLQQIQIEARRIQTAQKNLRFESLRNQLSPHFLFNSLNTISALLHQDIRKADAFIRHLAGLYCTVMDHYSLHTIPLGRELKLVKDYGFLMQTRFGGALLLSVDIRREDEDLHIPPLSVQILVENAIKHNALSMRNPLEIQIYSDNDYLVVRNNLIPSRDRKESEGITRSREESRGLGLKNIESRYAFLSAGKMKIDIGEFFTVSLPLLKPEDE